MSKNTNELKTGAPGRFGLEVSGLLQKGRVLAQDGMKQVARNLTDMWDGFLVAD